MGKKRIPCNMFKLPLFWHMKAPEIILYTAIVNYEPGTVAALQEITGMSKTTTQAAVRHLVDLGLITSCRDYMTQEMAVQVTESARSEEFIFIDKRLFNSILSHELTPDEFKFVLLLKYRASPSGRIVTTQSELSVCSGIGTDAIERYVRGLSKKMLLKYKYLNGKLRISIDF